MKKIYIFLVVLLGVHSLINAQGIYQMWGMTLGGGLYDNGTIFSLNSEGDNFQQRHSFNYLNGSRPLKSSLSVLNGKFYGLTSGGGITNSGIIFEWNPSANSLTKKIDFSNTIGTLPYGSLVLYSGKFYGTTRYGGTNNGGVIFEWDPATNIYTKKINFINANGISPQGDLVLNGNKFYGLTAEGGANGIGVLFEWDPITNIYTKKVDFNNTNGNEPTGSMILNGGKLYGMTMGGGSSNYGVIFEWDPFNNIYIKKYDLNYANGAYPQNSLVFNSGTSFYGLTAYGGSFGGGAIFEWNSATNIYTKKIDLNNTAGANPQGNLTYSNGKYYGTAAYGGSIDSGTVFQWDPVLNVVTKKVDFTGLNGIAPYGTLTLVNASVAKGTSNSCSTFASITIDNDNNNIWVPIVDNLGDAVAEIKANGNNLGVVNTSMYINAGPVREDAAHKLYLDRNLTITPTVQPTTPVNVRLYLKGSEFLALKNAINSLGQPSGINTINDVGFFKNNEGCLPALQNTASPIVVTGDVWNGDYVLTATVNSFSSFYAANKANAVLSLSLLEFKAQLQKDNGVIYWKTTNEINTNSFDIERSLDGINFKKVGAVLSYNSSGIHDYSYLDESVTSLNVSKIYYRLKQKDNDGKSTYSSIVLLIISKNKSVIIYPNPANETLTLSFSNNALLHTHAIITDIQGKQVKQFTINSLQEKIDISNLSKGTYMIKLSDGDVEKFLKN